MKKKWVVRKGQEPQGKKKGRLSYLGACLLGMVGTFGLIMTIRLISIPFQNETESPVILPAMPTITEQETVVSTTTDEAVVSERETKEETVLETEVATSVFREETPFLISLPVSGEILLPFSEDNLVFSKSLGDWRVHRGVDFKCDIGSEVRAAAEGIVLETYSDPQMGETIVLSHGSRYKTVYRNLASVEMVEVGESIGSGQVIGAVGDSAAAEMLEESHLHFEVLEEDIPRNPMVFAE